MSTNKEMMEASGITDPTFIPNVNEMRSKLTEDALTSLTPRIPALVL